MHLTGKQKRHLRGLGHVLEPVIQVGRDGLTDNLVRQADDALEARELIKVRFGAGFEEDRDVAAAVLAERTRAAVAGTIGRTALLYRPRQEDPEIRLPRAED